MCVKHAVLLIKQHRSKSWLHKKFIFPMNMDKLSHGNIVCGKMLRQRRRSIAICTSMCESRKQEWCVIRSLGLPSSFTNKKRPRRKCDGNVIAKCAQLLRGATRYVIDTSGNVSHAELVNINSCEFFSRKLLRNMNGFLALLDIKIRFGLYMTFFFMIQIRNFIGNASGFL